MSFFAYLGLIAQDPEQRSALLEQLCKHGYLCEEAHLARQFGMQTLYGFAAPAESFFEVEFSAAKQDLEALLLEPRESNARWRHYQACAARLGRTVTDFRQDEDVDRLYRQTSLELRVVTLLRDLAVTVSARPLVLNLDPEFQMHLGRGQTLSGLEEIRRGVWEATAFQDLVSPLRLLLASPPS